MITVRPATARGHFNHGWLDTSHTFSFADYYDPEQMGFRSLRVINEDRVEPGEGFGTHPHRDMEIVTVVVDGALEHRDSMGNGGVLRRGDVQQMTAGSGIMHSEFNHSSSEPVHFLQIWMLPQRRGLTPSYDQRRFAIEARRDRWLPLVTPDARDGALTVHQDAALFATVLSPGTRLEHPFEQGRHGWLQVVTGTVTLNGVTLGPGDGAAISDEAVASVAASSESECLLFDLA